MSSKKTKNKTTTPSPVGAAGLAEASIRASTSTKSTSSSANIMTSSLSASTSSTSASDLSFNDFNKTMYDSIKERSRDRIKKTSCSCDSDLDKSFQSLNIHQQDQDQDNVNKKGGRMRTLRTLNISCSTNKTSSESDESQLIKFQNKDAILKTPEDDVEVEAEKSSDKDKEDAIIGIPKEPDVAKEMSIMSLRTINTSSKTSSDESQLIKFQNKDAILKTPEDEEAEVEAEQSSDDKDTPEVYIVEKILDKKISGRRVFYYLKWVGYPSERNTWEPSTNMDCDDLIKEFEESIIAKPKVKVVKGLKKGTNNPPKKQLSKKEKERELNKKRYEEQQAKREKQEALELKNPMDIERGELPGPNSSGLDYGYIPESILGFTEIQGEIFLLVKFKDTNKAELIPKQIIYDKFPLLLIQAYAEKLSLNENKKTEEKNEAKGKKSAKKSKDKIKPKTNTDQEPEPVDKVKV